jgi:hypothetical protein
MMTWNSLNNAENLILLDLRLMLENSIEMITVKT